MTPQELIKEKLDIVELLGGYIQLKPAGGGTMKGLCPFHGEKTPSFHVSRDKQLWHCFGCGIGGDHFEFVMRMEGLDFPEALRLLAERTGVEIPRYSTKEANEKTRLFEILHLAERYYAKVLADAHAAEIARAYVVKRQIPEMLAERFGIGYSPETWDALSEFLLKKGYKKEELVAAGLASPRREGSGVYDRFRGRLMFPIRDQNGRTVGFTGRVLAPDAKEAKYVNTPQTALYDKGSILYGLDLAKQAIREAGFAIIVEGQMDVVGSWRGGVQNVVGSSGTALTEKHVALLKRYTNLVCLAFDADAAGLAAARRGVDLLFAAEIDVKIITLPPGIKDPDECTVKNPQAWRDAVSGARHIIAFAIEQAKKQNLTDPLVKKRAVGQVVEDIGKLKNPIERDEWLRQVEVEFRVSREALKELAQKQPAPVQKPAIETKPAVKTVARPVVLSKHQQLSELVFGAVLGAEDMRKVIFERISSEMIAEPWRALYSASVTFYTSTSLPQGEAQVSEKNLLHWLETNVNNDEQIKKIITRASILGSERYHASVVNRGAELRGLLEQLREEYGKLRRKELEVLMREAEARHDAEETNRLLLEFQKLMQYK